MVKWKVEPCPGSLSTHIVPPMSSLRRLLMASPSPVPPYRRVVDASTWLKDWNSRPNCLARDPDTGIAYRKVEQLAVGLLLILRCLWCFARHRQYHFTRVGKFDGVADQVH